MKSNLKLKNLEHVSDLKCNCKSPLFDVSGWEDLYQCHVCGLIWELIWVSQDKDTAILIDFKEKVKEFN